MVVVLFDGDGDKRLPKPFSSFAGTDIVRYWY
jgi:hypothetical protein